MLIYSAYISGVTVYQASCKDGKSKEGYFFMISWKAEIKYFGKQINNLLVDGISIATYMKSGSLSKKYSKSTFNTSQSSVEVMANKESSKYCYQR